MAFYPGPTARLSVGLDYSAVAPVMGRQWFSWSPEPLAGSPEQTAADPESFRWEVAPARTCFPSAQVSGWLLGRPAWTLCLGGLLRWCWGVEDSCRHPMSWHWVVGVVQLCA